ncbi:MAG: VCBS domain-containing protein [Pseudomonadota bacterium]
MTIDAAIYATFSFGSYNPEDANRIPDPAGWSRIAALSSIGEGIGGRDVNSFFGFGASVYESGVGEVVIAYRGTELGFPSGVQDVAADVLLGLGIGIPQVYGAVDLFIDVAKTTNAPVGSISFTGHSLGGGLAAIMAILLDADATVFAPAPFEVTVFSPVTLETISGKLIAALEGMRSSDPGYDTLTYAKDRLDEFIGGGYPLDTTLYRARQENVEAHIVRGEFLSNEGPVDFLSRQIVLENKTNWLEVGDQEIGGMTLHSMALHAACLLSREFVQACNATPEFLSVVFDGKYYPTNDKKDGQTFLALMVKSQLGATAYGSQSASGPLDRLAADILQLSSISGNIDLAPEMVNGLIGLTMQYHFEQTGNPAADFISLSPSGDVISFDISTIAQGVWQDVKALSPNKGNPGDLLHYLQDQFPDYLLPPDAKSLFEGRTTWQVAAGSGVVSISGAEAGDILIGSREGAGDYLAGNAGADVLFGLDGNDTLNGGGSDDLLYGGVGEDTYVFTRGDGVDRIIDSDGAGVLVLDGVQLSGGVLAFNPGGAHPIWYDAENDVLYEFASSDDPEYMTRYGTLTIYTDGFSGADRIVVSNYKLYAEKDGEFGLTFVEKPKMSVVSGVVTSNPYADVTFGDVENPGAAITEGGASPFTLAFNAVSEIDRTVTLAATGATGLAVVTGDDTIPFAGGTVTITIPAGQSMVTFGLLQQGDVDANESIQFTATLPGTDGASDVSTGLMLTINANVEGEIDGVHLEGNAATTVLQGGVTNDLIEGHKSTTGGTYNLYGMGGDDLIYADDAMDETQLLAQLETQAETRYATPYRLDAGDVDLHGGGGNDKVFGNGDGEQIAGGDGNDLLAGGGGNDVMLGDILNANRGGTDRLYGGSGDDLLSGEEGADVLHGGTGNDFLYGGRDADLLLGGDDDDLLLGDTEYTVVALGGSVVLALAADANDFLDGGAGNDRLSGGGGDDALFGGAGNDRLKGGSLLEFPQVDPDGNEITVTSTQYDTRFASDNDYLDGEGGDDQLEGGVGDDWLLGGEDNDLLFGDYADSAPEYQGNDTLYGEAGNDQLLGYGGNDALDGGDGIDRVIGGNGRDYVAGGAGDDHLEGGAGEDRLFGGDGNDTLYGDHDSVLAPDAVAISLTDGDADYLDGGTGNDVINGQGGDDEILGGAGADQLTGSAGNDTIYGGAGSDFIRGDAAVAQLGVSLHGDDYIDAGADDDNVFSGGGNDVVHGGDGADSVAGEDGADVIYGGIGNDTLHGDAADVALEAQGADELYGEAGNDYLVGYGGDDILDGGDDDDEIYGMEGADTLIGGAGNDVLYGNEGNDVIAAGDGNDLIQGGTGDDTLDGGLGDDVYYIAANEGVDHIVDAGGADTLALSGVSPSDIRFGVGSLKITFAGGSSSAIHIEGFNPSDISSSPIETIAFANATGGYTAISVADLLLMQGFDIGGEGYIAGTELGDRITGSASADFISGMAGGDAIDGGAGADVILGGDGNDTLGGGEGGDYLSGDAGNDVLDGNAGSDILVGGAGNDTYRVDAAADQIVEAVDGGVDTVVASADFTLGSNVENLALSGGALAGTGNELNNTISGTASGNQLSGLGGNDVLLGAAGNDVLDGGAGADRLEGGLGDDTYIVDASTDVIVEQLNAGADTVYSTATYTLSANVETLVLQGDQVINGTGSNTSNVIVGNDAANFLIGGNGTLDILYGYGGDDVFESNRYGEGGLYYRNALTEYMYGGTGNDSYHVTGSNTFVVEYDGEGIDTIYAHEAASSSYFLPDHVDNLMLSSGHVFNGYGNSLDNEIRGNSVSNNLYGGAGNDTLTDPGLGGHDYVDGGTGADYMNAGYGRDTYIVDNAGDVVFENDNAGDWYYSGVVRDLVLSSATYTLLPGSYIEDLTLTGTEAIDGTGNALGNVITGNAASNTLSGLNGDDTIYGNDGNDVLYGGAGNDLLDGGSGGDVLSGGDGNDQLLAGTGNDTLYGDAGNDRLEGGVGDDLLYGGDGNDQMLGGAGSDVLYGGNGNDAYWVDDIADVIVESAGEGVDTVYSSVNFNLAAAPAVEDLVLSGAAVIGLGNDEANRITGTAQGNFLSGGKGNDVLSGGDGSDVYLFNAGDGQDVIASELFYSSSTSEDTVRFGQNIAEQDLYFVKFADGIGISVGCTADFIRINTFSSSSSLGFPIEWLEFSDGHRISTAVITEFLALPTAVLQSDVAAVGEDAILTVSGNVLANDTLVYPPPTDPLPPPPPPMPGDPTGPYSGGTTTTTSGTTSTTSTVALSVQNAGVYVGQYGTLDLAQDGSWVYTLANDAGAVQSLRAGELQHDVFAYLAYYGTTFGECHREQTLTIDVTGTNDVPLAVADQVVVGEDSASFAVSFGYLLLNDSDADAGDTVTVVAVDGVSAQGISVVVTDGLVQYDAGAQFNALTEGEVIVDTFGYTVSDVAGTTSTATVSVEIIGANDAPILVAPVADQGVAGGTAFTFAVPAGTFTDVDNNDVLALSATLADGSALPAWLVFDAATGTFSGTAPVTAEVIALNVAATDLYGAIATDQFVLTVTGAVKGGGQGNEGVGNGQDAPPPGHGDNQNDGPGTSPGNPGNAQHRNPNARYGWQSAPGMVGSWDLLEGLFQFQLEGLMVESEAADTLAARAITDGMLSVDDQIARLRRACETSL